MLRIRGISSAILVHVSTILFLLFAGRSSAIQDTIQQVSIASLDQTQVDIIAESFVTFLEYYEKLTALNISTVEFETVASAESRLDDSTQQYMHLALVYLPDDCIKDNTTDTDSYDESPLCDLVALGVGKVLQIDYPRGAPTMQTEFCCTAKLLEEGLCEEESKLLIDPAIFNGQDRLVKVPQVVGERFSLGNLGVFPIVYTGKYAVLLANCKKDGLDLRSIPSIITSVEQRFMEQFEDYYICLTFFHCALFVAFLFAMTMIPNAVTWPIHKWLAATMAIAALDILMLCINYSIYNNIPASSFNAFTVSVFFGVLKRGISMVVGVMVAKGWGRVRYELGTAELVVLGMLGFIYTAVLMVHSISNALIETNLQQEIEVQGGDLTAMGFIFAVIVFVMDIIFVLWMGGSVRSTIMHLKSEENDEEDVDGGMVQGQIRHHRILGSLLTLSVLVMMPAWIIQFVDNKRMQEGVPSLLKNEQWNYMNAVIQGIYTVTLVGVAALWIPKQQRDQEMKVYDTEMKELRTGDSIEMNQRTEVQPFKHSMALWIHDTERKELQTRDGIVDNEDDEMNQGTEVQPFKDSNGDNGPNGLPVIVGELS